MTNKSSLYVVAVTILFAGIIAKIRAAYERQVPIGYQDENGFHLGVGPDSESQD